MLFTEGMAKYFATSSEVTVLLPKWAVACPCTILSADGESFDSRAPGSGTLSSSAEGVSDSDGAGAGTFDDSLGNDSQPFVALLQGVGDFPPSGVGEFPLSGLRELPLSRAFLSWTVCVLATSKD